MIVKSQQSSITTLAQIITQMAEHLDEIEIKKEAVLAEYDVTFNKIISGYLKNYQSFDGLSRGLASMLERGIEPDIDDTNLQLLWEHAECGFEPGIKEADIDLEAYFELLREEIGFLGGDYLSNTEEEDKTDIPGFSSVVWTFTADEPEIITEAFHNWILSQLE